MSHPDDQQDTDLPPLDLDTLNRDILTIKRASRGGTQTAPAAVGRNAAAVEETVERWLPVAAAYRDLTSSPAQKAHWTMVITPVGAHTAKTFEAVMLRARDVLTLLHALKASASPGPSVTGIATALALEIARGDWAPGTWLVRADIASDYRAPDDRVRFALADLAAAGVVTAHPNGAYTVPHRSGT